MHLSLGASRDLGALAELKSQASVIDRHFLQLKSLGVLVLLGMQWFGRNMCRTNAYILEPTKACVA